MTTATRDITDAEFDALIDSITAQNALQVSAVLRGVTPGEVSLPEWLEVASGEQEDFSSLPQTIKDDFNASKTNNQGQVNANKGNVGDLVHKRQNNEVDDDEYDRQVDNQINNNINNYTKDQQDLGRKLKEKKGTLTPKQKQDTLTELAKWGKDFLKPLWDEIKTFIDNAFRALQQFLDKCREAWEAIKNAFNRWFG